MMNKTQMPAYLCHKKVHALHIAAVEINKDWSATIAPKEVGFAPFKTRSGWAERFSGTDDDLGVYVVYEDGFTSWSPTAVFEAGYSLETKGNSNQRKTEDGL